jgi:hypothetical protein
MLILNSAPALRLRLLRSPVASNHLCDGLHDRRPARSLPTDGAALGNFILLMLVELVDICACELAGWDAFGEEDVEFVVSASLIKVLVEAREDVQGRELTLVSGRRKYAQIKTAQAQPPQINPV